MKKALAFILAGLLALSLIACGGAPQSTGGSTSGGPASQSAAPAAPAAKDITIGLVTDIGGFGDKGYNDASLEGLKKAQEEFGIELITIESQAVSDYVTNVETLSEAGCLMVITTGTALSEAVASVAPKYPDVHYVVLEGTVEGVDNVASTVSREQEGGFLLGYLAASLTEGDKLGFIAAIEGPAFERFETGYRAGAIRPLMTYRGSVGFVCEAIYIFVATDLVLGQTHPDEDEFVTVEKIPLEEAAQRSASGQCEDGKTNAGILATSWQGMQRDRGKENKG